MIPISCFPFKVATHIYNLLKKTSMKFNSHLSSQRAQLCNSFHSMELYLKWTKAVNQWLRVLNVVWNQRWAVHFTPRSSVTSNLINTHHFRFVLFYAVPAAEAGNYGERKETWRTCLRRLSCDIYFWISSLRRRIFLWISTLSIVHSTYLKVNFRVNL